MKKHKKKQVSPTSTENNNELTVQDVVELGGDEVGTSYSTVFAMIHVEMTRLGTTKYLKFRLRPITSSLRTLMMKVML